MAPEIILQHWIFTKFILPFLLIFFIVFAVLEKTKIFGDKQQQLDALISFIIALIFVGAVFPKLLVSNLILFLTIALVVVFVILLVWGFITGGEAKFEGNKVKTGAALLIILAVAIVLITLTGIGPIITNFLFSQDWSSSLWINLLFIIVIAIAVALVLKSSKGGSK